MAALDLIAQYYGQEMAGYSIPAAEHSTITSWGRDNEAEAYANMLAKYPTGLVAVVSDSYDIFKACKELWGEKLREKIFAREGTVVIRPDSGDPQIVILRLLEILGERFGYTTNEKGFKVLHPKIRLIQGDGITYETTGDILEKIKMFGWSADNIAFGSGGGLLQNVNRDSQKFAFKASAILRDGGWSPVSKSPVTDFQKRSKEGRLALVQEPDGAYRTVLDSGSQENKLVEVFRDGQLLVDQTFADIRARAL